MVILAITPAGLQKALALPSSAVAVWCGSDAISEDDFGARVPQRAFTRFDYALRGAEVEILAGALATIAEHHPGEVICVEHRWPA